MNFSDEFKQNNYLSRFSPNGLYIVSKFHVWNIIIFNITLWFDIDLL